MSTSTTVAPKANRQLPSKLTKFHLNYEFNEPWHVARKSTRARAQKM